MPKVYNLLSLDIAEFLQQYIEEKKLMPGDKLPSERELAITLSVTRTTLRHGLEILVGKVLYTEFMEVAIIFASQR